MKIWTSTQFSVEIQIKKMYKKLVLGDTKPFQILLSDAISVTAGAKLVHQNSTNQRAFLECYVNPNKSFCTQSSIYLDRQIVVFAE